MALRCYHAMTAAEFEAAAALPLHTAWMACHFSCYGLGLSNLPRSLPENAMIIVNDRTPVYRHDPMLILEQLTALAESFKPSSFLLDFQRPEITQASAIVKLLTEQLPYPVGVTESYAKDLCCPVFLSVPPLHVPLQDHLAPWKDREIWLEAALDGEIITVRPEGSKWEPSVIDTLEDPVFEEESLHCSYHIDIYEEQATFTLSRNKKHLVKLLEEAEAMGVTQAVGLYQQLG